MFRLVKRRFRPVIYLLVLAQLLLSAPMVSAVAATGAASASGMSMPCAGDMPMADETGECPCCPDGVTSEAGCLVTCIASVAPPQAFAPAPAAREATAPVERIDSISGGVADPPLKPPPIS
jgi:hypothetical protein